MPDRDATTLAGRRLSRRGAVRAGSLGVAAAIAPLEEGWFAANW